MTITIDLINNGALNLLQGMEHLNLIRLSPPAVEAAGPSGKLSGRFAGALHLSDEKYAALQNTLKEGRAEWERDIY
jgi:hypothetical protein